MVCKAMIIPNNNCGIKRASKILRWRQKTVTQYSLAIYCKKGCTELRFLISLSRYFQHTFLFRFAIVLIFWTKVSEIWSRLAMTILIVPIVCIRVSKIYGTIQINAWSEGPRRKHAGFQVGYMNGNCRIVGVGGGNSHTAVWLFYTVLDGRLYRVIVPSRRKVQKNCFHSTSVTELVTDILPHTPVAERISHQTVLYLAYPYLVSDALLWMQVLFLFR